MSGKKYRCRNPLTGEVTTFLKPGQSGAEGEKSVVCGKPESGLGTAMQRALFMEGIPGRVIGEDGKIRQQEKAGGLRGVLKGLQRTPKMSTVEDAPPGLDADAWANFCLCAGNECREKLYDERQVDRGARAEALQADWANYRRANPNLAPGLPVLLMCSACADQAVAAAAPCEEALAVALFRCCS
jgi:hypothetical protein